MRKYVTIISNLAYLMAGIPLLFTGTVLGIAVGISYVFLSIVSTIAHIKRNSDWWRMDTLGMYLSLTTGIAFQIDSLWVVIPAWGLSALGWFYHNKIMGFSINTDFLKLNGSFISVGVLFSGSIGILFFKDWIFAIMTLVLFSLALGFRQWGELKESTSDKTNNYGHALWHMLTGTGLFALLVPYL